MHSQKIAILASTDTSGTATARDAGCVIRVIMKGEPMTENERKTMMILADTIQGEVNRMCVTKELSEFDTMYGHAKKNLEKLSKMIYDTRFNGKESR
jgi:hypothetical protein